MRPGGVEADESSFQPMVYWTMSREISALAESSHMRRAQSERSYDGLGRSANPSATRLAALVRARYGSETPPSLDHERQARSLAGDDSARRAPGQQCGVPNGSHVILNPGLAGPVTATFTAGGAGRIAPFSSLHG